MNKEEKYIVAFFKEAPALDAELDDIFKSNNCCKTMSEAQFKIREAKDNNKYRYYILLDASKLAILNGGLLSQYD